MVGWPTKPAVSPDGKKIAIGWNRGDGPRRVAYHRGGRFREPVIRRSYPLRVVFGREFHLRVWHCMRDERYCS